MLQIRNLHASVGGKEILKGIDLTVKPGEIHALMGLNGAGKSTLSYVLAGHPAYTVTEGSVTYRGKDLLTMSPDERAHEGIFLSFQQPVEIPGVMMFNFMRAAINAKRKASGQEPIGASEFRTLMQEKRKLVGLDSRLANRGVNEGFSGGERKRNEIFQMAMLEPSLAILDETDSGLDVDALRIVGEGFNRLRKEGMSLDHAVMEAGVRRFKAIVMTSLTTILAVLPSMRRGSMGADLQFPLNLVVVTGMVVGTLVSLFFVPMLYREIYRRKERR